MLTVFCQDLVKENKLIFRVVFECVRNSYEILKLWQVWASLKSRREPPQLGFFFATMAELDEDASASCFVASNRRSSSAPLFSLAEEGCLRLMPANSPCPVGRVVYHKSLNVLLAFSQDGRALVVDIASGTVLHDTKALLSANTKSSGEI